MDDETDAPATAAPTQPARASARSTATNGQPGEIGAVKLRRKDLIDRVTATLGAPKGSVREIVAATLQVMGDALKAGEALDLPAFGKARVAKPSESKAGKAGAMTIKLRQSAAKPAAAKPAKPARTGDAAKAGAKAGGKVAGKARGAKAGGKAAGGKGAGRRKTATETLADTGEEG